MDKIDPTKLQKKGSKNSSIKTTRKTQNYSAKKKGQKPLSY